MTPTIDEIAAAITERYPIIQNGLLPQWQQPGDPEWDAAEWALAYIAKSVMDRADTDASGIDQVVDSFAETSIDFLRLQARFRQTREYARGSAEGLVEELYGDSDEMEGSYLDGLAMTYAMWPNHAKLLDFYRREFVAGLPDQFTNIEIGPGHGLLGFTLLSDRPQANYVGVDISEPALGFISSSFAANGLDIDIELIAGDATNLEDDRIPNQADSIVCCEVLEHVDEPGKILDAIRQRLAPGGKTFLSTVANLEAIDHVYLYNDADEIRTMIADHGLRITSERPMELPGDDSEGFVPLNYACIAELA